MNSSDKKCEYNTEYWALEQKGKRDKVKGVQEIPDGA